MKNHRIVIAVDAMGGDHGVAVTVPAACRLLTKYDHVDLILVGDEGRLRQAISDQSLADQKRMRLSSRISIQHTTEQVLMNELPAKALKNKKDSSMRKALNLVRDGVAQACVSAGNTGALVATARFVLRTLPGVDRPAITTRFPTMIDNKNTFILDLGANVDSKKEYLLQLAAMGTILSSVIENVDKPRVALLNIGSEEIKGSEQIKQAAQLLSDNPQINYVGFIEGHEIFKGTVDVIVCDGFIGNIMLKTVEGVLNLVKFYAKAKVKQSWYNKLAAVLALPLLFRLQREVDPEKYNGAILVGLRGTVIKSHGGAGVTAFTHALENAVLEVERGAAQKMQHELERILTT